MPSGCASCTCPWCAWRDFFQLRRFRPYFKEIPRIRITPRTEHSGRFVGGVGGRRPWFVLAFRGSLTNKMLWEGTKRLSVSKASTERLWDWDARNQSLRSFAILKKVSSALNSRWPFCHFLPFARRSPRCLSRHTQARGHASATATETRATFDPRCVRSAHCLQPANGAKD